ncbi:MAG: TIGR02757 family protein [Planctomycetota bacterium]|jgi:uncharacterized protein (TIGR02757 family)
MTIERIAQIKEVLERLYVRYNRKKSIPPDPLQFVYRYTNPVDKEIVGLLSAVLAYGRVRQIEKSLTNLLANMGDSPFEFVLNFGAEQHRQLQGFKHRFTTGDDISDLLTLLKKILVEHGCIENFFLLGYRKTDANIIPALTNFCDSLTRMYAAEHNGQVSRGLKYLLPTPTRRSACKRLNLFLRWMVRNDDVDTGLWKSIDKSKLIVPVDVHMARLSRILGFHTRKAVCLATAVKITEGFAKIEPTDPVKFDFALSRIGILENCTGRIREQCVDCELSEFCLGLSDR